MSDYNLLIDTPENLTLEAEVAGFGSRFVAAIVDYIVIGFIWYIGTIIFVRITSDMTSAQTSVVVAVYILLSFALIFFYHLGFELLWNGQTPGKRLFGLRIVQINGMPASATAIIIRNMVRLFDFLPALYGIGLLVMFASRHSQRLGDMAARTIAVYERKEITLKVVQEGEDVRFRYAEQTIEMPDFVKIDYLDAEDRHLITQYLNRRSEMVTGFVLARIIAHRLITKMQVTEDVGFIYQRNNAEKLMELIARAYERYDEERQQRSQDGG